jgi:hypothetical protein
MANPNQTWKYFDKETGTWKTVRKTIDKKTGKKTGVAKLEKQGVPVAIFWLKAGKETGSYFTRINPENLPKGVPFKHSAKKAAAS